MPDELIRIFSLRNIQDFNNKAFFFGDPYRPNGIASSGVIAVIRKHKRIRDPVQQPGMLLAECGTQRCHRTIDTGGMKTYGIHIAFYYDRFLSFPYGLYRYIHGKKGLPLGENLRLTCIQILGQPLSHYPSAKGNHPSAGIFDGNHHTPDKSIQIATVL